MNKDFYRKLHDFVLEHGWLHKLVTGGVKILPGIVYAAYPLLIVYFGVWRREDLLRGILVPAMGFLLVTVLRAWINAPRPYEAMGIPSITPKNTKGKSFPSRHAACGSVIAVTALFTAPALGWVLLIVSLLIALSRVMAGVHYVKDVLAGWLLGAAVGLLGFLI